jgi:AbrB family looped-hinge helix DNA binding protein
MATATITAKNQITIPSKVRRELRLERGDRVAFERTRDGRFVLRKERVGRKSDGAALPFIRKKTRLSGEEMKKAAATAAAKKYRRPSR